MSADRADRFYREAPAELADVGTGPITPHIARIVLWHFSDHEHGYAPSGGMARLLDTITGFSPDYQARIGLGFPGEVAACRIAQSERGGMDRLREIAKGPAS